MTALPRAALELAKSIVEHAIDVEVESLILVDPCQDWGLSEIVPSVESTSLDALRRIRLAMECEIREMKS